MRTSSRILWIAVASLLTDFALYVVWVAIPYKAIALGGGAAYLGLLPAVSSTAYVASTLAAGRLSDRIPRLRLSRFGALGFILACLLVMQARSLTALILLLPLISISAGSFWAPLQAAMADEDRPERLERNIGLFNVCWSVGKGMGFLLGGGLYARWGASASFLTAAAAMVIVVALLPRHRAATANIAAEVSIPSPISPARLRAFLVMAWLGNAAAFGIANTLNLHYPKFLLQLGRGPAAFGLFLACVFIAQAGTMAVLRHVGGWKFRRLPAFSLQGALALALLAIPFMGDSHFVLIATLPIGIALGFAYHASITYSLLDRAARGRQAGMHEAILGGGNFLLPLIGGLVASGSGDLRMPYFTCVVAVVIILAIQQWRYWMIRSGS